MVDTNKRPQPLVSNQAITKQDGTPTDYFIRWAQERQIAIENGITQADLEAFLAEHALQAGHGIKITPSGSLTDDPTIALDAGLGDLKDVDFSTAPTDGQSIVYDAATMTWKPGAGHGAGGVFTPPVLTGTNSYYFVANTVDVFWPAGTVEGSYAVIGTNHAWDPTIPAGWVVLSHLVGSNTSGATIYKQLDAADITAGKVTINYSGSFDGVAIIAVYDGTTVSAITLGSEQRTSGPAAGVWTTTVGVNPADMLFLYGGLGDYAATVFFPGTQVASALGPVGAQASADLYEYTPTASAVVSGTAAHTSAMRGIYVVCAIVKGITYVEEAPLDGQLYARKNAGWTAFVPGGGGGGGGGGVVTAAWWRIRAISGSSGHQGDGMGFMGVNWRDSGGTALIGTGTPIASRTDGSWNLAQAFDGDVTSGGHGWYSGNGDGSTVYTPWIGYHFPAPVTPASVEFAPLASYPWTVPLLVAHEFSTDGETWVTLQIVDNIAGAGGVVETYPILPQPGGGGAPWYFSPPLAAIFTDSFGTPTAHDDPDVGYQLSSAASMSVVNVRGQALPGAGVNWTATMHMVGGVQSQNYANIGFAFYNAAHNKFFLWSQDSRSCVHFYRYNGGGFDGYEVLIGVANDAPRWFRVRYDAATGNAHADYSYDGKFWTTDVVVHDVKSDFGGVDPAFIGPATNMESGSTYPICVTVDHWTVV